jgi:hypothetical protein
MKYENARRLNFILHTSCFILFLACLALYAVTMNPDVQPADSGELQLAAIMLGIPHPPGYPLFTMLGWLFAQIPIGSAFARVTFLSVIASAGCVVLVAACALSTERKGESVMERKCDGTHSHIHTFALSLFAAFTLATSTTFWAQATTTNIRSLTAFFTALMVLALIRFQHTAHRSWLIAFALALGFGVGHHVSLVFIGAVFGLFVVGMAIRARLPLKDFIVAGMALVATQLVWLYLPLRNSAGGALDHGDLATLQGFLDHVLARGFEGDLFYFIRAEPNLFWDRLALTPTLLQFQFSAPVLVLMALAAVTVLWRERALGFTLLAAFALHLFITLTYRAPQTVEYAMPCWVIACVVLGRGLMRLEIRDWRLKFIPNLQSPISNLLYLFLCFFVFIFPLRDALARYPSFVQLGQDRSTRANAEAVLRYTNQNEAVFSQWHQATPMWALQEVERLRPDVRVNYVYPQGAEPYETTFAKRAAESAKHGNTYVTSFYEAEFGKELLQAFPLSNTPAWRVAPELNIATANFPRTIWDDRIILVHPLGLPKQVEVGSQFTIDLWWSSRGKHIEGDSISVRILRRDGRLATNADVRLTGDEGGGIARFKRAALAIPYDLEPGDYEILAGAYTGATIYKTNEEATFVGVSKVSVIGRASQLVMCHNMQSLLVVVPGSIGSPLLGVDYDTGVPNQLGLKTQWSTPLWDVDVSLLNSDGHVLETKHLKGVPDGLTQQGLIAGSPQFLFFQIPIQRNLKFAISNVQFPISLPNYANGDRYIPFADQLALIGSSTQRSGDKLTIDLRWLAAQPLTQDYKISVRLRGTNFYKAHDGVPALGAIPTLKWIRGSEITDRHVFDLAGYIGPLEAEVVVYDNVTRLPLIPLDERYVNGVTIPVP